MLGCIQDTVGDGDGPCILRAKHVRACELAQECDESRISTKVRKLVGSGLKDREARLGSSGQERSREGCRRLGDGRTVTRLSVQVDSSAKEGLCLVVVCGRGGGLAGSFQQRGLLRRVSCDAKGLAEEDDCLLVGAEGGRPLGGGRERDAGLDGERVGLCSLRRAVVGGEVMAGEGPCQLVGPQ